MDAQGLKILELNAENVKRLRAVHLQLDPDAGLVVIGGRNDQGKTSVLDSFMWALGGGRTVPDQPIHKGAEEGKIEVTLDGEDGTQYHVTRTFTEKGSYLTVEDANGRQFKSPQSLLDDFLGELSFDPLEFAGMSPSDQREALLDATGLREELEENEQKIDEAYENRREAKRDLKKLQNKLEDEEVPDAPDEEIDKSELMEKLREARQQREENQKVRRALDKVNEELSNLDDSCADKTESIEEINKQIEELKNKRSRVKNERDQLEDQMETKEAEREDLKEEVSKLEDPDISSIEDEIEEADEINERVRERKRIEALEEDVKSQRTTVQNYERHLEELRAERQEAIQEADLPLEGLNITRDGVEFEGFPFDQLSSSKQLKVSTAVAMSLNPELRVLRIEDGSLLDSDNMEQLEEMAEEHDFHIWLERVSEEGDDVSVIIEDGEIKEEGGDENTDTEA